MPNTMPPSTLDPVDVLIARLYQSALSVSADTYRSWALHQLQRLIPHDGALWGSGSATTLKFHTVTTTGLPPHYPQLLEETSSINPIVPHILRNLETPIEVSRVIPDDEFFNLEIYRKTFAPFGINRILTAGHLDPRTGMYSLLSLYRKDRERPFTDLECARQKRIIFHMIHAGSLSYFQHLSRARTAYPPGAFAAVIDHTGAFHEATQGFLDLLDERFPDRRSNTIPFEVPDPETSTPMNDLVIRCEALGDLLLLIAWPAGPLDRLTAREREIVTCVAQGLSFKQAAKKIGVAPSTVANHLYRVYRKLGVYSRTELAELVHPKAD